MPKNKGAKKSKKAVCQEGGAIKIEQQLKIVHKTRVIIPLRETTNQELRDQLKALKTTDFPMDHYN